MNDFLFDTPWYVLVVLIGGGLFVGYSGMARSDRTLKIAGLVATVAGIVLLVLSLTVRTDKEKVAADTKQIIADVAAQDWTGLQKLLAPQSSLPPMYNNRQQLIDGARKTVETIGLKSATVTSMDVVQNDTTITVDLTILSTQDQTFDRPTPTNWRFDWEDRGNGWQLQRIEPQGGRQVSQRELVDHLAR